MKELKMSLVDIVVIFALTFAIMHLITMQGGMSHCIKRIRRDDE